MLLMSSIREIIGNGTWLGITIIPDSVDKMTVMMLEEMGIKVEPKALLQYSANNEYDNEYGLYM